MPPPSSAPSDGLARLGATAIALGRIAIGVGAMGLTRPALRALGFAEPDGATVALARLAGGRDIALGLHGLSVRDDSGELRKSVLLGAAVDAGDTVAFAAALIRRDGIDRTAAINVPIAGAAVAAGIFVAARLGRDA